MDLLTQLVNKSLVIAKRAVGQETRYRFLETIRQYAWEKLKQESQAEAVQSRHLNFFLQLAETAEYWLQKAEQIVWLHRLETEQDNFRAALTWSLELPNGDLESGLRLATALSVFWTEHGYYSEGRRWLEIGLAKRRHIAPPVRARLLLNTVWLLLEQWDSDPTALVQESLTLYRQLDDKRGIALNLLFLGFCGGSKGKFDEAASLMSESRRLSHEVDDKTLLILIYTCQADLAKARGNYDQEFELAARGLALACETGDRQRKHRLLVNLGMNALRQGDYIRAVALFQESLPMVRELQNRVHEGEILNHLGDVARVQRAYEQAAVFYQQSLTLYEEAGHRSGIAMEVKNMGLVRLGQGDGLQAKSLFRKSMVYSQGMRDKGPSLWNVWGLARVALFEGRIRRAAQLLATSGLLRSITYLSMVDLEDYKRDVALARTKLGEEAFVAAWSAGQAMSLEEAMAYALAETGEHLDD